MTLRKARGNLTEGPIFTKMLMFAIPIILTGVLQTMYSMADNIVVGKFSADPDALGAVGSTTPLTTLIINFMLGISTGASVIVAQLYGAKKEAEVSRAVHTAMSFSLICGITFMTIGLVCARPVLILMGTKADLLEKAILYMVIICVGIPATAVYNFGAAIIRSVGDSKTSLYILSISGLINVLLNLFFVTVCGMSVGGVAWATTISKYISAIAIVTVLLKRKGACYRLSLKKLKIERKLLGRILRYGIPMSVQNSIFSVSNIILTGSLNAFPKHTISAKTIASSIEGVTSTAMSGFSSASTTFVGQNFGAKKYGRINKVFLYGVIQVAAIGIFVSQVEILFGRELALLYIDAADPSKEAIVADVLEIFDIMLAFYFLCGIMNVMSGVLRGIGYSVFAMTAAVIGVVARTVWIIVATPKGRFHSIFGLFVSYPGSWLLTIILLGICIIYAWRKSGILQGAREEKKLDKKSKI